MGSILRAPRLNPTQVPTVPVEIDWGHPLAQGLVGCWLFNGDARDYSFVGAHGALGSTTAISGTAAGPQFLFDDTVNSAISMPAAARWASLGQFTYETWVVPAFGSGAGNFCVINANYAYNSGSGFALDYNSGSVSFVVFFNSTGVNDIYGSGNILYGRPNHLVFTYDGTTGKLFLNGVFLNATTTSTTLNLGSPTFGYQLGNNYFWLGSIGKSSFYARALGASEVFQLYAEPFAMLRPIVRRAWFVPASTSLAVSSAFIFINESISVAVAISDEQTESLSQAKSNKQGNFEFLGSMQAGTMAGHDALSRDAAVSSAPAENTGSTNSLDSPYLDSSGANTSVNTLGDAPVSWLASASSAVPSTATESLGSDSTSEKSPSGGEASLGSVEPATAESGSSTLVQREALGGSLGEAASRDEPLVDSNLSTQTSEKTVALEGLGSAASTVSPYIDTTGTNDTVETLGNAPLNWLASVVDSTLSRLETATAYSSTHQQPAESQGTAVSLGSVRTTSVSALTLNYAAMSSILSGVVGDSALSQECLGILHTTLSAIVGVISTLTLVADSPPLESLRSFSASAGIADSETLGALRQNLHVLAESAGANNLVIGADSIALEALSNAITYAVAFVDTLRGPAAPAPSRVLEVAITKRMLSVAISLRKLVTEE